MDCTLVGHLPEERKMGISGMRRKRIHVLGAESKSYKNVRSFHISKIRGEK